MGSGTYDVLHEKLRKLVFEQGLTLDAAAERLQNEYEAHGPAATLVQGQVAAPTLQQQLPRTLNEILPPIRNAAQEVGRTYERTLTPEEMERRYKYSQRCRNVMMKIVKESVQRDIVFRDTATKLFGDNPFDQQLKEGEVPKRVDQKRWMEQLMRLEDSDEARYHNEEVVSLAMLGECIDLAKYKDENGIDAETGKKKFRQARYNHYFKDLHQTEAEANKHADEDLNKGVKRLVEMTFEAINAQRRTQEEVDQARDAILTGAAERNPGGLEGAYRTIMNPGNALAWNIRNEYDNFVNFGENISEDEYKREYYPYQLSSAASHSAVVSLVANPYYAVLDGGKLADAFVTSIEARQGENRADSPLVDFGGDVNVGIMATQQEAVARSLARFGFVASNDTPFNNQPNHISVYSNGNRSVIFVGKPTNMDQGLNTESDVNRPGQLINCNYDQWVSKLQAASVRKDQFLRSSPEYRAMKRALNGMSGIKIPDNGDPEKLRELEQKLEVLKAATDAYLARKNRQFAERGAPKGYTGKNPYEQTRYRAATDIATFVAQMNKRITHIRQHQSTVPAVLEAEQREAEAQLERNLQRERVLQNDAVRNDAVRNDAVQNDAVRNDAVRNDAVRNDAVQNNAVQDNVPEEKEKENREDEKENNLRDQEKILEDEKEHAPEKQKEIQEDEEEIQEDEKEHAPEDQKEIQEDEKKNNLRDQEKILEDEKENNLEDQKEIREDEKEHDPEKQKEIQEDEKENNLEDKTENRQDEDEIESEDERDSLSESDDEALQLNNGLKESFQEAQESEKSELSASHLLNRKISNAADTYRRMKRGNNNRVFRGAVTDASQAPLGIATLKYMVEQDSTGALANAVEKDQIDKMVSLVQDSGVFREQFLNFPLERMNAALENEELFCKPVGDALLAMAKDTITAEGQRLQAQREQQVDEPVKYTAQQQQDSEELNKALGKVLSAAKASEQTDWAKAEREFYSASPAEKYLDKKVDDSTDVFSAFAESLGNTAGPAQNAAKKALALSTLQYMMEADPTQMVLENVVERDQYTMLQDMILESRLFEEKFNQFVEEDPEQLEEAFSDKDLFAKPVGNQILSMVKDSLVQAAPQVAEQKKKDYFHSLKDKVETYVQSSEAAQRAGNTALAEQQGRDALALQSASALLIYTNENGKLPKSSVSALTEKVKASDVFQSALEKVDLKNPEELRGAISQNLGKTVAESILTAEKQKGLEKALGEKRMAKPSAQKGRQNVI